MSLQSDFTTAGPSQPQPLSPAAPSTPYTFRLATPADAPQVSHLIGTTWAKHFAYSVTESDLEHYLSTSVSVHQISNDISNPSMRFVLATMPTSRSPSDSIPPPDGSAMKPESVIGVAQLIIGSSESCLTLPRPIEVRRLYVDSAHHGSGLAADLVRHTEDLGRKEGYGSIWLGVWEDNKRGLRFYEKMGFKCCGEHSFLVGESVRRDWVMEKAL